MRNDLVVDALEIFSLLVLFLVVFVTLSEFHGVTVAAEKCEQCKDFILRVASRSLLFSTVVTQLKEKSASNE